MSAAVAARARRDGRFLRAVGFLAEAGKRVVFAEKTDNGAFRAPFSLERRLDAAKLARDLEAVILKEFGLKLGRLELDKAVFRKVPDLVADVFKFLFVRRENALQLLVHDKTSLK